MVIISPDGTPAFCGHCGEFTADYQIRRKFACMRHGESLEQRPVTDEQGMKKEKQDLFTLPPFCLLQIIVTLLAWGPLTPISSAKRTFMPTFSLLNSLFTTLFS